MPFWGAFSGVNMGGSMQVLQKYAQLRAPNWREVDAAQTPDKVAQDVQAAAMPFINEARQSALPKPLW